MGLRPNKMIKTTIIIEIIIIEVIENTNNNKNTINKYETIFTKQR